MEDPRRESCKYKSETRVGDLPSSSGSSLVCPIALHFSGVIDGFQLAFLYVTSAVQTEKGKLNSFDEKLYLSSKILKAGEDPYRQHAFNQLESDKLSSDRPIRDTRHYRCTSVHYDNDLPSTSVIITFHNEARSTLLRTIKRSVPVLVAVRQLIIPCDG
ncbi:unnamed protein product [Ranitomeya imitator]|uniref:Glycosyltransferase 2-like domain-containing protein n=1 Tax=Ranitomeya imitator TaxID=111125 RepID=A0ABN9KXW8_9NEOB|nr:unnamed protein product [Ranitomeya imitator]